MNAVDTNILIYVHDPRDARKRTISVTLVDSLIDGAMLWQVACEFLSASFDSYSNIEGLSLINPFKLP